MANNSEMYDIGIKIIESAIMIDESLAELLKDQVKLAKKQVKSNVAVEEHQKLSNLIKYIIIALTLTDEKIRTGIEICINNRS